jgi:hypothetical protein
MVFGHLHLKISQEKNRQGIAEYTRRFLAFYIDGADQKIKSNHVPLFTPNIPWVM